MTEYVWQHDTPVGRLTLLSDGAHLTGLFMPVHKRVPDVAAARTDRGPFSDAVEELDAYFAGALQEFSVPVRAAGTPFQQRVWSALRDIPYGHTTTYGRIAQTIGSPTAVRAVGLANGRNPVSIVVPCHRVVGANGALTGYGGGLANKELLLDLERRVLTGAPVPTRGA